MVRDFARQSGGHAELESRIGRGTTVSLHLPALGEQPATPEVRASPQVAFGSESILLVEDDSSVRATVRRMLEDFGYRVSDVGDGPAAIDHLQQGSEVDLVCTDLVMPGALNGWQLALAIWKKRPRQRILFCTGYADSPVIEQMGPDSRIRLLHKPFGRRDLAAAVRRSLDDGPK
jgi:CheY-like chemotaxis protein